MKKLVIALTFMLSSLFIFNINKANAYTDTSTLPLNNILGRYEYSDGFMVPFLTTSYVSEILLENSYGGYIPNDSNIFYDNVDTIYNGVTYYGFEPNRYIYLIDRDTLDTSEPTILTTLSNVYFINGAYLENQFIYMFLDKDSNILYEHYTTMNSGIGFYSMFSIDFNEEYHEAYELGRIYGFSQGRVLAMEDSFNEAREIYGFFSTSQNKWLTAVQYGDIRYQDGVITSQSEAFEAGKLAGANESFLGNFDKWIVPAIIVVMFVGGFFAIARMKRDSQ